VSKKSSKSPQAAYEADKKKFELYGTAHDEDGKLLLCIRDEETEPKVYFYDTKYNRRRLHVSTFRRLINEGKAVRVDNEPK